MPSSFEPDARSDDLAEPSARVSCPSCGAAAARDGARYCEECGAAIPARCPSCGGAVPAGKRFCGACGAPLRVAGRAEDAPGNRQASVIVVGGDVADDAPILHALGSVAEELEGVVVRVPGGAACVFGSPRSLEDHLQRALLAALRLRDGEHWDPRYGGVGVASGRLSADQETWVVDGVALGPIEAAQSLAAAAGAGEVLVDSLPRAADPRRLHDRACRRRPRLRGGTSWRGEGPRLIGCSGYPPAARSAGEDGLVR